MTGKEDHPQRRSEAFFGRRKGQKLHRGHQRLIETRLPQLLVNLDEAAPAKLADLFPEAPVNGIQLEIGFGGGEHLIHQALENPTVGYIGVEPFLNGLAKAVAAIDKHGIPNLRLYNEDATELLDWLPANAIDRIYLLYPDPWPKRRHWKRRFVSQKNLGRFAKVLKSGAEFRFATDIDTYQNWTLQKVHTQGKFKWTAQSAQDWREPWQGWIRTRYEAKAIREGRRPGYFRFVMD